MPYIKHDRKISITATGGSYKEDTLTDWVGSVAVAPPDARVINEDEYAALVAENDQHNRAIVREQPAPAPRRVTLDELEARVVALEGKQP